MVDIQKIKSSISCVEYAQRIGLPIRKSGDRCVSPLRAGADNKTAFIVMDDFFYDFVAGIGGDVIEFCSYYAHNGNRGEAIRELAHLLQMLHTSRKANPLVAKHLLRYVI